MGEDMTVILLTRFAGKVVHVPRGLYHYVKLNQGAFSNTSSARHLEDIRYNTERVLSALQETVDEKDLALFKLNVKLPFLLSGRKEEYRLWREWYPEADRFALDNPCLPARTRWIQWAAAKGQFWLVSLYGFFVNKIYYGLKFRT